ncbi:hypothetical protein NIES4101_77450 [Calothrix sp. NIES-4101]|nr:hypothetical protein NIES4101_77450 [Calothrix sp. NIES-4101]
MTKGSGKIYKFSLLTPQSSLFISFLQNLATYKINLLVSPSWHPRVTICYFILEN